MVGFNRRFSPHSVRIKELLKNRSEPLAMNFTVNAGMIPPNVWVHDPETGGGRIIGEACHFMDLMSFLHRKQNCIGFVRQDGKRCCRKGRQDVHGPFL